MTLVSTIIIAIAPFLLLLVGIVADERVGYRIPRDGDEYDNRAVARLNAYNLIKKREVIGVKHIVIQRLGENAERIPELFAFGQSLFHGYLLLFTDFIIILREEFYNTMVNSNLSGSPSPQIII